MENHESEMNPEEDKQTLLKNLLSFFFGLCKNNLITDHLQCSNNNKGQKEYLCQIPMCLEMCLGT